MYVKGSGDSSGYQSRLLALRRQLGCHSGENLAVTLSRVVREFEIEGRVGTVISDNVSSNDNCLQSFYGSLNVEMGPADIRARRMRCYGRILNLVARAFLYGEDFEAFEAESQVFNLLGRHEDDLRHWRKKGPVESCIMLSSSSDYPLRGANSSRGSRARTMKRKNISWRVSRRRS